ncbi:MAG: AsmA-like C-terminal domain-containing protein [Alphaproteobacteria bacterium]|nr:AsmA-like C-terminal domain-containing protein [Alphaproteobacteria bacterium]
MRRSYFIRKFADYFGVALLLSLLIFLWLLYHGPLAVPFLKPYIIEALNSKQNEYTMNIGEVNLELVRSIQPLKVIAKDVTLRKNDGNLSVKTPKLFLSFSVRALLNGVIAPSKIIIKKPTLSIFTTYGVEKDKENEINQKKLEVYFDWFEGFLERFNSPQKIYPESYINDIAIQNANIEFHEVDLGRKWQFSNANLRFNRNFTNLDLSAGGVVDLEERMATINAAIKFNPIQQKLTLQAGFADVVVSDFIKEIGGGISSIDVPIEGNIKADINFAELLENVNHLAESFDSAIEHIDFNLKGSAGKVEFEHNEHFDYPIDAFAFEGEVSSGLDSVKLKKAELKTGDQKVELEFSSSGYQKYFLEKSLDNLNINFKAKVDKLKMDDLARFWPRYFAEPAWQWCKESLYGGQYQNADFEFEWGYNQKQKALELLKLKGTAEISDGTVYYLEGMPEVTNVYGTANFDIGTIDIELDKGLSGGIMLDSGHVRLYDLDQERNYIDIKITGDTDIPSALKYINNPPLEFTKDLGIDTSKIDGNVNIDLGLNFELYQDLQPEDIKVDVNAVLSDVVFKNAMNDKNLTAKKALLKVTQKGFMASGNALFDSIPVYFEFEQAFSNKNYQSKGNFKFRFDENVKQKLGINHNLLSAPYLNGFADIAADLTIFNNNKASINLLADIKNMEIDYSFLGFSKDIGESGQIQTKLEFSGNKLKNVPSFVLSKDDFSLNGNIKLSANSDISEINIENIQGPKTSASAKIEFSYQPKYSVKINANGNSYDLTELFAKREKDAKEEAKKNHTDQIDDDLEDVPDTEIFISVNNLWTNPDTPIKNFIGSATLKNGIGIHEMHIAGNHGSDKSIKLNLDYTPRKNGEYFLNIESNNAGSTLRVLRLYENMTGGILKIEAKKGKDKKMIGHAKIRDFKIHNTPLMAKLLTVASLSGMLDMLKGDGLVFSHFDAPFTYEHKTLKITDAKMFGNVIGFTSEGTVNRTTSDIDIKGIVSPAYSLNSMVGKIPFIGKVLAGSDGTIFAFDYAISNTIDDPKISINPLSILSPNSVKDLFKEE